MVAEQFAVKLEFLHVNNIPCCHVMFALSAYGRLMTRYFSASVVQSCRLRSLTKIQFSISLKNMHFVLTAALLLSLLAAPLIVSTGLQNRNKSPLKSGSAVREVLRYVKAKGIAAAGLLCHKDG